MSRRRQHGATLLALAAMVVLGISWALVSAFSTSSRGAAAASYNARLLAEAKAALVAWVAANALESAEQNPGRLPCPQAWGDVGSANEGRAAAVCSNPVGWLPWRTLGLPAMLDASGRQLWYVVSPGWHLPNASTSLVINSDTTAQLTLDGRPVIALIIAPGRALAAAPNAAQLAAGCNARVQSAALMVPPNPRDFLECYATLAFRSGAPENGANPVFNDQVVAIAAADLLPALEAAIAKRIERDIAPPLRAVYAGAAWGLSAAHAVYPFAAPFANPGGASFQGAAGTLQGLLPFNETQSCSGPRCLPDLVGYAATPAEAVGAIESQSCVWESAAVRRCEGLYAGAPVRIDMSATFTNVAMGLRVLDASKLEVAARDNVVFGPWQRLPVTYSAVINDGSAAGRPAGSATVTFGAQLPGSAAMGWTSPAQFRIRVDRSVIADHPLLDPASPGTGWFVRNEWYRLVYYALAPGHTASAAAPRSCATCLEVANLGQARAILILAGRSLKGAARPNGALDDFLEGANADAEPAFESRAVNAAFNDRVVVLDANP
jgi:hypothetical protein